MTIDPPLRRATDAELGASVQENLFALFQAMTRLPGSDLVITPRLSYHHAPPSNPMFKGVWRARLSVDDCDAAIDDVLAWFAARDAPYFFWWTGTGTTPVQLPARLEERGFIRHVDGDPGMFADLHHLVPVASTDVVDVREAVGEEALEAWQSTFCEAFDVPAFTALAWVHATRELAPAPPWRPYVAYVDGRPVGTSLTFDGAGVVGVYAVSTLAARRRRGVGAALTMVPLLAARERGYRYAVLFASDMGYPLYRKLGFRDGGGSIGRYLWWPEF